jgi:predicted flap endonuclease-1-like 5' DNA nuclease
MWDDLFKRWIDLLFWWLPRNEEGPPEKEEEGAGVTEHGAGRGPEQGVEQQLKAEKEVTPDDLTVIKGIGPSVQEKLRSLGIMTFEDLARADADRLVDQLKTSMPVSKARVRGWTEVARERTEARD